MVVTCHLYTVGIADLTAEGYLCCLASSPRSTSTPLLISNQMSFTSDTCNVMKGNKNGVIAKLSVLKPRIIDIDCVCHLVNLCVKTATKELALKIYEPLVDICEGLYTETLVFRDTRYRTFFTVIYNSQSFTALLVL